mmetsp:Transcript_110429/g.356444  ORF Transcript_110429/g.356444 Transcript_110429/m.356444 type:complete len:206 (-) Transcript_110429:336-953(-)
MDAAVSLWAFIALPAKNAATFVATLLAIAVSLSAPTKDSSTSPWPMVKISGWALLCRNSFTWICFRAFSMLGMRWRKSVFGPCWNAGRKTSKSMLELSPSLTSREPLSRIGFMASTDPLTTSILMDLSLSAALRCSFAGCEEPNTRPSRVRITTSLSGYWTRMSPATSRPTEPPPETTTFRASRMARPALWTSSLRSASVCPGVG